MPKWYLTPKRDAEIQAIFEGKVMAKCRLYQVKYLSDRGYVVYRQSFEPLRCTLEEWVRVHRTADFISEAEAKEYAEHRNLLVDKYGSDKLPEAA